MKNIEFAPMETDVIEKCLREYGLIEALHLKKEQLDQMTHFADFMLQTNTQMNLTGIIDPPEVADKHFADSLFLLAYTALPKGAKMIDVGTGAGFPAIPCALATPSLRVTMLDSLQKRIHFLQQACQMLSLDAKLIHGRAEEIGRKGEYREQYDLAAARAVAHLRELSEYCLPFVKVGGLFAAMKGRNVEAEIGESESAIQKLGGRLEDVVSYRLKDGSERALILIRKTNATAPKYPRASGKIKQQKL